MINERETKLSSMDLLKEFAEFKKSSPIANELILTSFLFS